MTNIVETASNIHKYKLSTFSVGFNMGRAHNLLSLNAHLSYHSPCHLSRGNLKKSKKKISHVFCERSCVVFLVVVSAHKAKEIDEQVDEI